MEINQNWLNRGMAKLLGLDIILLLQDSAYLVQRNQHPKEYETYIQEYRERYKNGLIMGGSFGIALLLSLRRYFPNYFNQFSVNRLLAQSLILGGTLVGSTLSVVFGGAKLIHTVKKDYIIKADPDYYHHMQKLHNRYAVDEQTQVRYALSADQFDQWSKIRKQASVRSHLL